MMEAIGLAASVITLAGLFKTALEAFDLVKTAKNQGNDFKKSLLKLYIERCRLYVWGQAIGLTECSHSNPSSRVFESCPFPEVIEECLGEILELFQNSETLKSKYGCVPLETSSLSNDHLLKNNNRVLQQLSGSFDNFRTNVKTTARGKHTKLKQATLWAIQDRAKFTGLISETKSLIDGLQDITKDLITLKRQESMMLTRIVRISDMKTLDMVSETCEVDYPAISDAATTKAETLSGITTFHKGVMDWQQEVEDDDDDSDTATVAATVEEVESWSLAELKHNYLTQFLNDRREERLRSKGALAEPAPTPQARVTEPAEEVNEIRTTSDEMENRQAILEDMAAAWMDKDFKDEQHAILQWFRVLSSAERTASFYELAKELGVDQAFFFAAIHNHRASQAGLQKIYGDSGSSKIDLMSKTFSLANEDTREMDKILMRIGTENITRRSVTSHPNI